MMIAKDNHQHLHEAVRYHFENFFRFNPDAKPDFSTLTGDETDATKKAPKIQHGRKELRQIWVSDAINDYLNTEFDFPEIAQVFYVRRSVNHYKKGKVTNQTLEVSVGITSLPINKADAKTLLSYNRGHWSIETVHRILDEANNWNEDKCRATKGYGPENMTALRRLAIAIIRRHQQFVAPTLRKLRSNSRMLLDYLGLTANTRRRVATLQ